jgi:vancomycin permeability regulator SanA
MQFFQVIFFGLIAISLLALVFGLIINLFSRRACSHDYNLLNGNPVFGAILIFGAEVSRTAPSNELKSRLDLALHVWAKTFKPLLVLSGCTNENADEPETMKKYLISKGVPEESIYVLSSSFNTRETLISFSKILKDLPASDYLAISSPYHALRIQIEAKRTDISLHIASDSNSPENNNRRILIIRTITEMLAIAFYAFPHGVTKRVPTSPTSLRHRIPSLLIKLVS